MRLTSESSARRRIVRLRGAALAADSAAQSYPNRPIRFIAPYGAGGSYDLIARLFAQKLGEQVGQQVIVDNRAGASGRIGMEIAVKAAPDGYTMFTVGNTQVIVPLVYGKAPYDLARDIAPLTTTATIVNVLAVNPVAAGEDDRRARRAEQGEAEHDPLRLGRHRRRHAPHGRILQEPVGRRRDARAVQGGDPLDQRDDGRRGADGVPERVQRDAAHTTAGSCAGSV